MGELKRIIFTVSNDLSYDQRMQKICRSLSVSGYAVELVGRNREFSIPLINEPYKQTRLQCLFNKGKLFYVEYNLRLLIYLLFSKFDAACAIDLDTIVPIYFAGKVKSAKLIYDAHEYFTEVPEVVRRPSVQRIWQWVEKIFVPRFNLVYTVSGGLAGLFQQKYGRQIDVIMNVPVMESRSPLISKSEDKKDTFILYQGALNEGRGLEHLITAMQEVNSHLKLAGEGDLSIQLRQQVNDLGLQQKVTFLGYVQPAELKQITAQATVGVNLVENTGLSYYYSLSNKFFDYIHAQIPQVCIAFPEYKKLNDVYGVALLIDDCNPVKISAALTRLLTEENLYAELQKKCEVCTRNLNWQQEEKKLLALYGQLFR